MKNSLLIYDRKLSVYWLKYFQYHIFYYYNLKLLLKKLKSNNNLERKPPTFKYSSILK